MTADNSQITERLVSFALNTKSEAIPEKALAMAKTLMLDTLGVALAAASRPVGEIICGYAAEAGSLPASATVLGTGFKTSPAMAAQANGTLANALDFDSSLHAATPVLPAVLAVAEQQRSSGRDVLDTFVLSYEIGAKLTKTVDGGRLQAQGPTHKGWWHVGLIGPISSALAAARLMQLQPQQAIMAVGIASTSSGGFRRNMGTMAKALHSGNSARAGIQAALLARRGFTADPAIIEAPQGFLDVVSQPEERDMAAIGERLGNPFVMEGSVGVKRYPACMPSHVLIAAALALHKEANCSAAEIELVEADLRPFSLIRPSPWDEESAAFSAPFVIAAALSFGKFTMDQITDEIVHSPSIVDLMKRIKHLPSTSSSTDLMTIRLRDGRRFHVPIAPKPPHLESSAEIEAKFMECASRTLSRQDATSVMNYVATLERQPDIALLMELCGKKTKRVR